jgi:hypothetical protein
MNRTHTLVLDIVDVFIKIMDPNVDQISLQDQQVKCVSVHPNSPQLLYFKVDKYKMLKLLRNL